MKIRFTLLFLLACTMANGQTGFWDFNKTPMPVPTCGSVAHLVDGKIFVIGGWTPLPPDYESTYAYDPAADTWEIIESEMPSPRFNCASAVIGSKIYIFGGNPYTGAFDAYDTSTNTWDTTLTTMVIYNTGREAVVVDDLIYVAGAYSTSRWRAEYFGYYDHVADQFTQLEALPHPVGHSTMVAIGRRIFVIGGYNNVNDPVGAIRKIQVYDIDSAEWDVMDYELPDPLWGQSYFMRGSVVYLFGAGGEYNSISGLTEVHGDMIVVDLQNQICRNIGTYPFHHFYPRVVDLGEEVMCIGGYISDDAQLNELERISTETFAYYPVEHPIYPASLNLDKCFCQKGESFHLTCEFVNPLNATFIPMCFLQGIDGVIRKTFDLFDDGQHGDLNPNDGIYGNIILMDEEFEASILIGTLNNENGEEFWCQDFPKVTSVGPVVYAGMRYFSEDTIPDPGDVLKVRPLLQNIGQEATATDISILVRPLDEQLLMHEYLTYYRDLEVNTEAVMGIRLMTVRISQESEPGQELNMAVEIFSGENLFWRDTVTIILGKGFVTNTEPALSTGMKGIHMQVYPNPVKEILYCSFEMDRAELVEAEIFNLSGQVVHRQAIEGSPFHSNKIQVDTSILPPGVYYIRLLTISNVAVARFIK